MLKNFVSFKAEVDKLDINKLVNVPSSMKTLKKDVDDLDVGKLKTASVDSKKLSDVVNNKNVKNTMFNTLKTKAEKLDKKMRIKFLMLLI